MTKKNQIETVKLNNKQIIAIIKPDGYFETDWREIKGQISHKELLIKEDLYKRFQMNPFRELLILGLTEKRMSISEPLGYLRDIAIQFVRKLSKRPDIEMIRDRVLVRLTDEEIKILLEKAPYLIGEEYLNNEWIRDLWKNINRTYNEMIRLYIGSAKDFFDKYNPNIHLVGRIFFHLVENESKENPFAFLATYSAYINEEGNVKYLPLKNALIEYEGDYLRLNELLSSINKTSEKSDFISKLVDSGDIFESITLNANEAYTFLKEIPIYEEFGISCRIPKWWKNKSESLKMSITVGNNLIRRVDFDSIVDFNADLFLGGEKIEAFELKKLLAETEGLAFIKGKWVEVDYKKLNETLKAYEKAQKILNNSELSIIEAMRFQINIEKTLNVPKDIFEIEVTNGEWIDSVVTKLIKPEEIQSIDCGNGFTGTLRDYQEKGLNWLYFMKNLGLGACLADDMGLGKTIQVIALLNYCKEQKKEKSLIVVPVSLIGNWMNEIDKNAPNLKYCILHSSENKNFVEDMNIFEGDYDVYITSYGMLSKYEWFTSVKWDSVILDEAQSIKNPRTKRTRSAKKIKSNYKVAMTGTPIENRLSDLWSLFDFLNKGLLGTTKEFSDFTKNLEEHQIEYSKLKHVVSPFILRRLKTDKKIISDLPDKIEMKTYSNLSKKQTLLYNELVKDLKTKFESSERGIKRKGLVLSAIMKFKQICNHPDQYLGQSSYSEKESGKFERLREICEVIYRKRERVIIFTQYREITEPLKDFLESVFKHKGLVLHGGTPIKKRKEIVEKFQGHEYVPFMVLSIKAGGVGLNLTSANHVIHFDRWWNPSVENQATDRAFRIGQMKNVIVHKFIMKGSIEEKIDLMIEDKIKLSEEVISNNQINLISEMDNDQLIDLFTLKQ
jgi:non-specific serine/threonine protein kinase